MSDASPGNARRCVAALLGYLDSGATLEMTPNDLVVAHMPDHLKSVDMVLDADDVEVLRCYALDAQPFRPECTARFWHGSGHQSATQCQEVGEHDVHRCHYYPVGGYRTEALWRDGDYTGQLREKGIDFDPLSYPENMGMSGYLDEPPQEDDEA